MINMRDSKFFNSAFLTNIKNRDPKGFCPDHSGIITGEEEIKKYINNVFKEEVLKSIYLNLENLFFLYVRILIKYETQLESKRADVKKDRRKNAELIQRLMFYLEQLALNNSALLHIIVEFFGKVYNIEATHICSDIRHISDGEVYFDFVYNPNKTHKKCKCYFLTLLIRIWNLELDDNLIDNSKSEKHHIDKTFVTFLKSYKFKVLYNYSYFSLVDTIMKNKSEHIKTLSVQMTTIENIAEQMVKNHKLIINFYEKLKEITIEYLSIDDEDEFEKKLTELFNIYFEFYLQTYYLLKPKVAKVLSKNFNILKILIDILGIFQNSNKIKISTTFQREAYEENLLYMEVYLLKTCNLIISNMDYSDMNLTSDCVSYLIDKIIFEDYKTKLDEKEYSFHIPLQRVLGMLINRICYDYQENKIFNFNETLRQIIHGYYNSLSNKDDLKNKNYETDQAKDTSNFDINNFNINNISNKNISFNLNMETSEVKTDEKPEMQKKKKNF